MSYTLQKGMRVRLINHQKHRLDGLFIGKYGVIYQLNVDRSLGDWYSEIRLNNNHNVHILNTNIVPAEEPLYWFGEEG